MTQQGKTKQQRRRYPTTVPCMKCGGPVYAVTEREQQLIQSWPRDGFWMCEKCRGKGR